MKVGHTKEINVCSMNPLIVLSLTWPIILSYAHRPHPKQPIRPFYHHPQCSSQRSRSREAGSAQAEPQETHFDPFFDNLHSQDGRATAAVTPRRRPPRRVRDRVALALLCQLNVRIKGRLLRAEIAGARYSPAGCGGRGRSVQPQRGESHIKLLQIVEDLVQLVGAGRGVRIKCYK